MIFLTMEKQVSGEKQKTNKHYILNVMHTLPMWYKYNLTKIENVAVISN